MESIIAQLLRSPKLNLYMEQIQTLLDEEYQKRTAFYELVTERLQKEDHTHASYPAEFINGEIVYRTAEIREHTAAREHIYQLIKLHVDLHSLGETDSGTVLVSLTRNDYCPDVSFLGQEKARFFTSHSKRWPAPDLIVEVVAAETDKIARTIKLEDYEAHAIQEYWIVNIETQLLEQYYLVDKSYELLTKSSSGMVKSRVLTDFEMPIQAIFKENLNFIVANKILKK